MNKSKYLKKFCYSSCTPSDLDKLVTWRGDKVRIVDELVKLGRVDLLAIAKIKGYDRVVVYTQDGVAVGESDDDLDLYVDVSSEIYVNVKFDKTGEIKFSKVYHSEEDAIKNRTSDHFDTICINVVYPTDQEEKESL